LHEAQRLTLAAIRVVDSRGIVVATTGSELAPSLAGQHEVGAALAGGAVSTLRQRVWRGEGPALESISRGSDLRVFVALPAIEAGHVLGAVVLSRTPRSIEQALYGKRYHLIGMGVVLLGGGAFLAWFTALTVSAPVRAVMLQARRVAAGERGAVAPIPRPMTREIADLSTSLVSMVETLKAGRLYPRLCRRSLPRIQDAACRNARRCRAPARPSRQDVSARTTAFSRQPAT
jgi:hypothetical protein